jgi:hypothetical protein
MKPVALTPSQSLDKSYRLQNVGREQIELFKREYLQLLGRIDEKESEENAKGHLTDFLKNVYYAPAYLVATKGRTDFVIHTGRDAASPAGVLFETKRPANRSEMVTRSNLNAKAMHELMLYYLRERTGSRNSDMRHLVITNLYEWFTFDAAVFERLFYRNATLLKDYHAWAAGQKVSTGNDLFTKRLPDPTWRRWPTKCRLPTSTCATTGTPPAMPTPPTTADCWPSTRCCRQRTCSSCPLPPTATRSTRSFTWSCCT